MKNKLLALALLALPGCERTDLSPNDCPRSPSMVSLISYRNAEGIVHAVAGTSLFWIEVTNCRACQMLRPAPQNVVLPPVPCNLPRSYQKDGLSVTFSGVMRADTTLNYGVLDLLGLPTELTAIRKR